MYNFMVSVKHMSLRRRKVRRRKGSSQSGSASQECENWGKLLSLFETVSPFVKWDTFAAGLNELTWQGPNWVKSQSLPQPLQPFAWQVEQATRIAQLLDSQVTSREGRWPNLYQEFKPGLFAPGSNLSLCWGNSPTLSGTQFIPLWDEEIQSMPLRHGLDKNQLMFIKYSVTQGWEYRVKMHFQYMLL